MKTPLAMPFRASICPRCLHRIKHHQFSSTRALSSATAIAPAPDPLSTLISPPPIARYPPTQPPSHKDPGLRNAQLIRFYDSLIRSTPLLIFFQHNNLNRTEWIYVRRELRSALLKVDAQLSTNLTDSIKLSVIQNRMFAQALAIIEHFRPDSSPSNNNNSTSPPHPTDPSTQSSFSDISNASPISSDPSHTHALSTSARNVARRNIRQLELDPLLVGPIAVLNFPTISTAHLKAALSILVPEKPLFPPPTRRSTPSYHDPATQSGIQKLMLLGARLDGQVVGAEEPRKVGLIEGGMDGLRGQVVALLQSLAGSVVGTLDQSRTGIWMTLEGRRGMLEDEENKAKDGGPGAEMERKVEGEGEGKGEAES